MTGDIHSSINFLLVLFKFQSWVIINYSLLIKVSNENNKFTIPYVILNDEDDIIVPREINNNNNNMYKTWVESKMN